MAVYSRLDTERANEAFFRHYPPTGTRSMEGPRYEELLRLCPNPKSGVEVGVHRGWGSELLLRRCPDLHLTMVDIWDDPAIEEQARARTEFAADRRRMLKMPSVAAARLCQHDRFDFVFIDADHEYDSVIADIDAWSPLAGIVSGHDYKKLTLGFLTMLNGVARAVDEIYPHIYLGADQFWVAR